MQIGVLVLFLLISSMIESSANVGDTLDQCILRYGQELPVNGMSDPSRLIGTGHTFHKDNFIFIEYISDKVVQCEIILKSDNTGFSESDSEAVLKLLDGKWEKAAAPNWQKVWTRSDGSAASCTKLNPVMIVMSKSYIEAGVKKKNVAEPLPSEAEVKAYIVVGMDEDAVIKKYGVPMISEPSDKDGELLIYDAGPTREKMEFGYGGFEVFCKNHRVTDVEIIHKTVR